MGIRVADKNYAFVKTSVTEMVKFNQHLFKMNFDETGNGEYNISSQYYELEKSNHLLMLGITYQNCLIGYCCIIANESLHTCELIAYCDAIYIQPEHRSYILFNSFLRYIEDQLKLYKIIAFYISSSSKRNICALLERSGFAREEILYKKEL